MADPQSGPPKSPSQTPRKLRPSGCKLASQELWPVPWTGLDALGAASSRWSAARPGPSVPGRRGPGTVGEAALGPGHALPLPCRVGHGMVCCCCACCRFLGSILPVIVGSPVNVPHSQHLPSAYATFCLTVVCCVQCRRLC